MLECCSNTSVRQQKWTFRLPLTSDRRRAPALDVGLSTPTQYDYFDVWGHPLMTSKKIRFSTHLRPCPHASTWAGPPPPPLWPSPRSRHEIHPAVLKRLIQ